MLSSKYHCRYHNFNAGGCSFCLFDVFMQSVKYSSIILSTLGLLRLHLSVIRNILLLFNDWFGCCSFSCHIWFFVLWCCAWLLFISMSCSSIFFNAVFGLCSFWSCFGNSSFYCRVRLLFFFMSCLDIVLFVVPL